MVEAVTWSFISKPAAELFDRDPPAKAQANRRGHPELSLANPIAADMSDMRPSLLPGLILAAQANIDRGFPDLALFEVGQIFVGDASGGRVDRGFRHPPRLRIVGKASGRHWSGSATADALDAKADAFAVLSAAGAPMQALQVVPGGPDWLHPGTIRHHPDRAAERARLFRRAASARAGSCSAPTARMIAFEVILDRIPAAKQRPTRARPVLELSPFQPVSRDFAFIVDRGVRAGDIVRAAQGVDKKLITEVTRVRRL